MVKELYCQTILLRFLTAVPPSASCSSVIKNSTAQTMMGLEKELKDAAASLQNCNPTAISLKAGCELFLRCALNFQAGSSSLVGGGGRYCKPSAG